MGLISYGDVKVDGDIALYDGAILENMGHHLLIKASDNHYHMHSYSELVDGVTTADTQNPFFYGYTEKLIYQPDESGSFTGQLLEYSFPAASDLIAKRIYHKTDTTAATEPVRIRIWIGIDDTGALVFDQTIPASKFPASSETYYDADGYVEYNTGVTYFLKYTSDADFSLKMEVTNTIPWLAADTSFLRMDNLLQTKPWVSGDTWDAGDYFIDSRKIYICNTTGIQSGTFASNSDKWYGVGDVGDHYWTKVGSTLTYNDGTQDRVKVSNADVELRSANGLSTATLYDAQYQLTITGGTKINIHSTATQLTGPGGRQLAISNTDLALTDGTRGRVIVDATSIDIVGEAGNSYLRVAEDKLHFYDSVGALRLDIAETFSQIRGETYALGAKLLITDLDTGLYYGTAHIKVKPNGVLQFNDGTRTRMSIDSSTTELTSPNGTYTLDVSNSGLDFNNGTVDVLNLSSTRSEMLSPDGNSHMYVSNTNYEVKLATKDRILISATQTRILDELGSSGGILTLDTKALSFNDGTKTRIDVNALRTYIHDEPTTGGGYIQLESKEFTFVDGTLARLEVTGLASRIISPDGGNYFEAANDDIVIHDGTQNRFKANASETALYAASAQARLLLLSSGTVLYGTTAQVRFHAGGSGGGGPTKIWSEDGQYGIRIDSTGIDFTRDGGSSWQNQYN